MAKTKKVILKAYYGLNGEYISFPENPLHNKTFENVDVKITGRTDTIGGINFHVDVISVGNEEPIDCELISRRTMPDGTLIIGICQDWG